MVAFEMRLTVTSLLVKPPLPAATGGGAAGGPGAGDTGAGRRDMADGCRQGTAAQASSARQAPRGNLSLRTKICETERQLVFRKILVFFPSYNGRKYLCASKVCECRIGVSGGPQKIFQFLRLILRFACVNVWTLWMEAGIPWWTLEGCCSKECLGSA